MSVVRSLFGVLREPLSPDEEARFRGLAEREQNFGPAPMSWIPGLLATLDAARSAASRYRAAEWAIRCNEDAIRDEAHNARVEEWRAADAALAALLGESSPFGHRETA